MYEVKIIDGTPTVVDAQGQPVPGAHVTGLNFPSKKIDGPSGSIDHLSGPGRAEVLVGDEAIKDVPVK